MVNRVIDESLFQGIGPLGSTPTPACSCVPSFEDGHLVVDAHRCPGKGDLARAPACRGTVVDALTERDVEFVLTRADGIERAYEDRAAALLVAAGRFVEQAEFHDEVLAERCRRDPLAAAWDATGRAGAVATIAAETGLTACASGVEEYDDILRPYVAPMLTHSRITVTPPPDARLVSRTDLSTGATARIYEREGDELRTYFLEPPEHRLCRTEARTLAKAYERLAAGGVVGGARAPGRAVRQVATEDTPVEHLSEILKKHTRGLGVLADLFADDRVSDVYVTAPVRANSLRVVVDGESMRSNVRLTEAGAETLASRFRRESGRAFSRACPSLDAVADVNTNAKANPNTDGGRQLRVAGLTDPASEGVAFAFRARDAEPWTVPGLLANGTLSAEPAGLLSLSVERGTAALIAGARGAGKTTLLASLLWELDAATRTVLLEDTQELPVASFQAHGRDVQAIRTTAREEAGLNTVEALRTALRLGEGALVLGEIRGEEARVLYEAMRVGAAASAVLGTVHGDGAKAVHERVVTDLGVPESSFGSTDLIITAQRHETPDGPRRRVTAIEEIVLTDDGCSFAPLYEFDGDALVPTGRIDRGESRLLDSLAGPDESYADVRNALGERTAELDRLARSGLVSPGDVIRHAASRRS